MYMYTQYTLPTFLWFLVSQFNSDFDLAAFDSWIRFYVPLFIVLYFFIYIAPLYFTSRIMICTK